jgi:hypothetical protein
VSEATTSSVKHFELLLQIGTTLQAILVSWLWNKNCPWLIWSYRLLQIDDRKSVFRYDLTKSASLKC